jgi:hypothetical protein
VERGRLGASFHKNPAPSSLGPGADRAIDRAVQQRFGDVCAPDVGCAFESAIVRATRASRSNARKLTEPRVIAACSSSIESAQRPDVGRGDLRVAGDAIGCESRAPHFARRFDACANRLR